jgi:twitching motility protein PilJ
MSVGFVEAARAGSGVTALLGVAALLLLASGVVSLTSGSRAESAPAAAGAPIDALYGIALDAQSLLGNEDDNPAGELQKHLQQLRDAAGRDAGATYSKDPRFEQIMTSATTLLQARSALADAAAADRQARDLVPRMVLQTSSLTAGLTGLALDATRKALDGFEMRGQRLEFDIGSLATGSANSSAVAQRLSESSEYMGQVIQALENGGKNGLGLPKITNPESVKRLKAIETIYLDLKGAVAKAVSAAPNLSSAKAAARALTVTARALADASAAATPSPADLAAAARARPPYWLTPALGAAAFLFLAAAFLAAQRTRRELDAQRNAVDTQRKENERNQQAILRLLDELANLANGDLTVHATVTEEITGAIADSINYAVDALRGLVTTINQSAIQLDSATRKTQALSGHLAKASVAQTKQIASATENAAGMAASVEAISGNAETAADVARRSVEVAHRGGDAVRRTIDGMNTIRETIQDTSKRIKRLGESSQEIGNIVELINDIAEQTNILALNASIQASMAGESGRGFAVVADEVQRLAERAAGATKQIEALVRTIQADTNEAIISMERSTTDVVGGATLAENAGGALEEIEQVSNQIASLVQSISGSARQQTGQAQNIARNMQVLKDISAQTAESTNDTSVAIAKLAELSSGLRKAAAGFRLSGAGEPGIASGSHRRIEEGRGGSTGQVRQISAVLGGT